MQETNSARTIDGMLLEAIRHGGTVRFAGGLASLAGLYHISCDSSTLIGALQMEGLRPVQLAHWFFAGSRLSFEDFCAAYHQEGDMVQVFEHGPVYSYAVIPSGPDSGQSGSLYEVQIFHNGNPDFGRRFYEMVVESTEKDLPSHVQ